MSLETPFTRRPLIFREFAALLAIESTRHGGVSSVPYASLNLGLFTEDTPENIQENRRRLFHSLGISEAQVAHTHQVHGDNILLVEQAGQYEGYDALITSQPGLFLSVTVADCTPILVYDPVQQAVAAIHAGWRGAAGRIVAKSLEAMEAACQTRAEDCRAFIGTCIDECSYEVGAEVVAHFAPAFSRKGEHPGKFLLDLKAANAAQLREAGVPESQIEISPYSTVLHNADYFSYRKEGGETGRMLAIIGLC
ncbi:MAG: peptidoglycan editing factor PgeF [Saprospirales bacterium]|nr:peptidoglycan editing factor PgeF [Saprospirales bacterium]